MLLKYVRVDFKLSSSDTKLSTCSKGKTCEVKEQALHVKKIYIGRETHELEGENPENLTGKRNRNNIICVHLSQATSVAGKSGQYLPDVNQKQEVPIQKMTETYTQ